jgi:hypothetical protein
MLNAHKEFQLLMSFKGDILPELHLYYKISCKVVIYRFSEYVLHI